jgi:hypothetical protein
MPTTAVGSKVPYKYANEKEKEMHRSRETETMVRMLSRYKNLCDSREVMPFYPKILVHIEINKVTELLTKLST